MLTIAYLTSRHDPKIEWFQASLKRESRQHPDLKFQVVVVDFFATSRHPLQLSQPAGWIHCAPKPTVWQGPYRLTKEDWFAASNARNTALCLAQDGHIAYVDDLSVLLPGWLSRVVEAMKSDVITLGAYRKVRDLVVAENGDIVSFTDYPAGHDNRYGGGSDEAPVSCGGDWLYGCSLVAPVEAFLEINGWPEICDGMGFEDCIAGIMLEKQGWAIEYDRRMMTYESEELHHVGQVMKRSDFGVSPNDKSHALLKMAQQGDGTHPGFFGPEGIRGLRRHVLGGGLFPVVGIPEHEFFTGTLLRDL